MRVSKFNEQETLALRALGFEINEDGDEATAAGQMIVTALRSPDSPFFNLAIELPDEAGMLHARCPVGRALDAAGIEQNEEP